MLTLPAGIISAALFSVVPVNAAPLNPRSANVSCFTTHSGVLLGEKSSGFGLNSENQMIYPAGDTLLNVHLQVSVLPLYSFFEHRPTDLLSLYGMCHRNLS